MGELTNQDRDDHIVRQEVHNRRQKAWVLTAVLTALSGGGLSGGMHFINADDKDNLRDQIAEKLAPMEDEIDRAMDEIDSMRDDNRLLRDAVIKLQAHLEYAGTSRRSRSSRNAPTLGDFEEMLGKIGREAKRKSKDVDVQQYREEMFE